MAFLRKQRKRYWLVHNFREGEKVIQVRLYHFKLSEDPEVQIQTARKQIARQFPEISENWVETVREKLKTGILKDAPIFELGEGFYRTEDHLYHRCQKNQPSEIILISLVQGRDLWVECRLCHNRLTNLEEVGPFERFNLPKRRISRFDRFCLEHRVGEACYIFEQYRGSYIARIEGKIQAIDYNRGKVLIQPYRGKERWRSFEAVHFGRLEVQLTDEQRRQILVELRIEPRWLTGDWYELEDRPECRVFLKTLGVRY